MQDFLHDAKEPPEVPAAFGFLGWVAAQELNFLGNPRFPLKGSFKGDIDTDIESYQNKDMK